MSTHLTPINDAVHAMLIAQVSGSEYMLDCYVTNPLAMHSCAMSDLAGAFGGQGVFGLTVSALVFIGGYFITDGDIVTPAVVLMLIGGMLVPALPGQYQTLAVTLMFAGGVGAVMQLLDKYVFSAGV